MKCKAVICILFPIAFLILPNLSHSGKYEYTQDTERIEKNKTWTELRQRIGEVYEVRPNKGEIVNFYEMNNSRLLEFRVVEKEKFTIVDGFIKRLLATDEIFWLSSSETWPYKNDKIDSFTMLKTIFYEVIFESGKVAYLGVEYSFLNDKNSYRLNSQSIKFVKKKNKEQINDILKNSMERKGIK